MNLDDAIVSKFEDDFTITVRVKDLKVKLSYHLHTWHNANSLFDVLIGEL